MVHAQPLGCLRFQQSANRTPVATLFSDATGVRSMLSSAAIPPGLRCREKGSMVPALPSCASERVSSINVASNINERENDITAVITFEHIMAAAMINRLAERGVRTPDDISIIGSDDGLLAESFNSVISTISPSHFDTGRESTYLLILMITGNNAGKPFEPRTVTIPTPFNVRSSSGQRPDR